MTSVEQRLEALEAAVAALQSQALHAGARSGGARSSAIALDAVSDAVSDGWATAPRNTAHEADDSAWVLSGLAGRHPTGAVVFAGQADTGLGPVEWQYGRYSDDLMSSDWEPSASRIEALGHPVRLRLLQRVLSGTTRTAELAETDGLGTTGQLHHHLRILTASGWLHSTSRGRYDIPPERVIPLLVIISAA